MPPHRLTHYDPHYDLEFGLCGERHVVRRTMDLVKRVEQRFGAIHPLCQRLNAYGATQAEMVLLFLTLLEGDADCPSRYEIERWLYAIGTHGPAKELAGQVFSLVLGHEDLMRRLGGGSGTEAAQERDRPFSTTDEPTSISGSDWQSALASLRGNSGP